MPLLPGSGATLRWSCDDRGRLCRLGSGSSNWLCRSHILIRVFRVNVPSDHGHDQQNYANCRCHGNHEKLWRRFLDFGYGFFRYFTRLYFWFFRRRILEHRSVHRIDLRSLFRAAVAEEAECTPS